MCKKKTKKVKRCFHYLPTSTIACGTGKHVPVEPCPKLPGTLLRIFIPAGAVINLLFLEVSSPAGICLLVRIPALGNLFGHNDVNNLVDQIRKAGGTVQVVS
ncbi:hypothetical protein [Heliorestis convoluta]|uniref:Uncharacterized protein n=1 Tax=Heliorestis convoluta TaxID=356322 RepID=A0A5Q2N3K0_9FIRM|nr:hypothetical protein [Heliorestis convoluta]QGG48443.1 hypothetical protein FTV88_2345 [Heliorestis convoluta]